MDPITAVGVASAALQIAQFISSTVQGLNTLKGKFQNADITIRLLISKLSTIKAAILQIRDWAEYSFDDSPKGVHFLDGLNKSLDGCQAAMDVLSEEVNYLTDGSGLFHGQDPPRLGMRGRARAIWNDETMKAHQDMLHGQIQALQLLLQAGQCADRYSQSRLMGMRENQRLIQRVVDDTRTLREAQSSVGSQLARSARESIAGVTVFDFDHNLTHTLPYQNAPTIPERSTFGTINPMQGQEHKTSSDAWSPPFMQPVENASRLDSRRPPHSRDQITEDLYDASIRRRTSTTSEPAVHKWVSSVSSSSDSQSPNDEAFGPKEKKTLQSRLKRLNTFSASKLWVTAQRAHSAGASFGSGHYARKDREANVSQSIDFSSSDALRTPPLVRNAQAGNMVELERLLEGGDDVEARHDLTQRTALSVAAHCGAVEVVALLLRFNARIDTRDIDLSTPLSLAASRGHCKVIALLLDEGSDVEATNASNQTPLWIASDRGYHKAVEVLLKRGAKINIRASNQLAALHAATKQGDREMVELLLRHNAHIDARDRNSMTALHHACEGGHCGIAEFLLQKGANIEARGKNSMSPLICATASGHFEVVELLLKKKAMLRNVDNKKANALHWAARNGHLEIAEYLLSLKMPIHESDTNGLTALHLAVLGLHFKLVDFLLQKQASVESSCREGRTPLHCACSSYSSDIVGLLLDAGASSESPMAKDGRQPIHIAAANGSIEIVETLYERGANISARDAAGDRALCIACSNGHFEIVEKLLSYGEPLRMPFKNRPNEDSPLCIAARAGHAQLVQLLIRKGASVKQRDEYGHIPLRYAAYYAHPEVVQVLLLEGAGLVDYGEDSGGLVLMLNPATLGFSDASDISDERKRQVRDLLNDALERHQNQERDEELDEFYANNPGEFDVLRQTHLSRSSIRHMLPSSPSKPDLGASWNREAEMWGGTYRPPEPVSRIPNSPPPGYVLGPVYSPPPEKQRPLASNPAVYDTTQGTEYYTPYEMSPPREPPEQRYASPPVYDNPAPLPQSNGGNGTPNLTSIRAQIAQLAELEKSLTRGDRRSMTTPVSKTCVVPGQHELGVTSVRHELAG